MRHHADEFSITDIRHTMLETWRIVCHRRWFFVFPFCITAVIASLSTLWVPRQYVARTVIKQERDPVFENMLGKSWTHPYARIRKRMGQDLQDEEAILEVLAELKLPEGLECFDNGELTPESRATRRALADAISKGLSIKRLTSSKERDVVAIELKMPNPEHLPDILRTIRDRYMAGTREKAVNVLRDVLQFFQTESTRCRTELRALQMQLAEYELKYPGIDPSLPDTTRTEEAALVVQRVELEHTLDQLKSKRLQLEEVLVGLGGAEVDDSGVQKDVVALEPNPRYSELSREIRQLAREIADKKTLQSMTEQHPAIRQLRTRLAMRQEELTETPVERRAVSTTAGGAWSAASKLRTDLSDLDARIATHETQLAGIEDQVATIKRGRVLAVVPRQDYLKLRQEAGRVSGEMKAWQQNIGPIEHIFTVEDRDRTIHFAMVEDVSPITKPSSPDVRLLAMICLAIAAAVGALAVLLTELVDRSYSTVRQLKSSLGLPVIESIEEIFTEAARWRRFVRNCVLMPASVLVCLTAMVVAGSMAYLSIENPSKYESLKATPLRAYQSVVEKPKAESRKLKAENRKPKAESRKLPAT